MQTINNKVKVKNNATTFYKYLKYHSRTFKARIEVNNSEKRKKVNEEGNTIVDTYYLFRKRTTTTEVDSISNSAIAMRYIHKWNFFKKAKDAKELKKNNFDFIKDFLLNEKGDNAKDIEERLANLGRAAVRRSLVEIKTPTNSIVTQEIKGFNNPLIDTGQLLNSITGRPLSKF